MPDTKQKTFLERPEGKTGVIVGLGVAGVLIWALLHVLPVILSLVFTTTEIVVACGVLFAVLWVLADPQFWLAGKLAYQQTMRTITNWIITIDPIGVLKDYVKDLKKRKQTLETRIGELNGQRLELSKEIRQTENEAAAALKLVDVARKRNEKRVVTTESRKVGRRKEAVMGLREMYDKMDALYKRLQRYNEASADLIADLEDTIDIKSRELKAIRAGWSAMTQARAILKGDPDKLAIFNQGMEIVVDETAQKVGEIAQFTDATDDFLSSVDLKNGLYEEEAMRMLDQLEEGGSLLLDHKPALPLPNDASATEVVPAQPGDAYSRLFK